MAKKERIVIRRDDDLEEIDVELDAALSNLDQVVQKVDGLLQSFETETLSVGAGVEMDENGEIVPTESAAGTEDKDSASATSSPTA